MSKKKRGEIQKGCLYFLAGCSGQFGFFLPHFTTVSLNPGSVFRTLLKSYFYNTACSWSQRQIMLLSLSFYLLLSLYFPIPHFALGGLLGKPFFLNHPSGSHQAHTREKFPSTALRCISTSLCFQCFSVFWYLNCPFPGAAGVFWYHHSTCSQRTWHKEQVLPTQPSTELNSAFPSSPGSLSQAQDGDGQKKENHPLQIQG